LEQGGTLSKELSTDFSAEIAASNREETARLAGTRVAENRAASGLRFAGIALAGSAVVALSAHIALPLSFTPVPMTLQPLAVLVVGLLLAPELAAATLALYLAEGALGLPVFAPSLPATLGLAHLMGPTGGYLMAYPAAAALASWLYRRTGRRFGSGLLSAGAALALVFISGAAWLAVWTHGSIETVFAQAVLPFLPGAGLNIAAAAAAARGCERLRRSR
jgi:biotin transport system substrate-specific component